MPPEAYVYILAYSPLLSYKTWFGCLASPSSQFFLPTSLASAASPAPHLFCSLAQTFQIISSLWVFAYGLLCTLATYPFGLFQCYFYWRPSLTFSKFRLGSPSQHSGSFPSWHMCVQHAVLTTINFRKTVYLSPTYLIPGIYTCSTKIILIQLSMILKTELYLKNRSSQPV